MNFKYKVNLYRRYHYWNRFNCIFVHVPKAAGTSINHALYGRTLGHYKATEIKCTFPQLYDRCFVFSVVRNPWDRLVSAYRFAIKGATGDMAIKNPKLYKSKEFRSFPAFVHEWLQERDPRKLDFVFQPQVDFLCDDTGKIIVDHWGKLEDIESTIVLIRSKIVRGFEVKKMNITGSGDSYVKHYNSELVDIVASLYKDDVSKFGYNFT